MIVAIDGPAGAGKSTVAARVARELGYQLIDTGALYRAVAYEAKRRGLATEDPEAVAEVARDLAFDFETTAEENILYCDGDRMGDEIRTSEVSQLTSVISSYPAVRDALLEVQRELGREEASVLEGRDIGTVVFPDADVKVFLTASAEERARRRCEQLESKGQPADYEAILEEIHERDERDRSRDIAPLKKAEDATEIDSTDRDPEEVVEAILRLVDRR
jgi:cytidylate kinase